MLAGQPAAIGGVPRLLWGREVSGKAGEVKVIVLPVGLRRLRFQEFVDHWTGVHAQLALGGPRTKERLVRLEDTPAVGAPSLFERTRYDGVGTLTFESRDALAAEFGSDYYRENLAPDESRFADPALSAGLLTSPVTLR